MGKCFLLRSLQRFYQSFGARCGHFLLSGPGTSLRALWVGDCFWRPWPLRRGKISLIYIRHYLCLFTDLGLYLLFSNIAALCYTIQSSQTHSFIHIILLASHHPHLFTPFLPSIPSSPLDPPGSHAPAPPSSSPFRKARILPLRH